MTSFIGVDMAWAIDGRRSGIQVMSGDVEQVYLDIVSTDGTSMVGALNFEQIR
jgi:hypothetical protein